MGITATEGGGDFQQAPIGNHLARLVEIIDIGTQHGEYKGEPTTRHQVIFRWELPLEMVDVDGEKKPFLVSKFYTLSTGEKANLRRDVKSWLGRDLTFQEIVEFDVTKLLNRCCMVSVIHDDKQKARVEGVAAVPKGMTPPGAFNQPKFFSIDPWDDNAFEKLPKGFQKFIRMSDEFKAMSGTPAPAATPPAAKQDSLAADAPAASRPAVSAPSNVDRADNPDDLDDDIPF